MPYRIDIEGRQDELLDRLVTLGALDVEQMPDGRIAALLPDSVTPAHLTRALDGHRISILPARGRDANSVWVLNPRPVQISGRTLRLADDEAFGTGLHPTTALCLEALEAIVPVTSPRTLLDVGTGSGVLALAALMLGVPRVTAIDIDDDALRVAAENARLNGLDDRLTLAHGGPESIQGAWPLVVANILAAPLIEMAPALTRRIAHHGELVLSGIPSSLEQDVDRAYRRCGMQRVGTTMREGWAALLLRASW